MTVDLTKIREPLGLLDEATQKALMEHGGPYEKYTHEWGWVARDYNEIWWKTDICRVKPEPPKPREIWVNEWPEGLGSGLHASQEIADAWVGKRKDRIRTIHFIEVI